MQPKEMATESTEEYGKNVWMDFVAGFGLFEWNRTGSPDFTSGVCMCAIPCVSVAIIVVGQQ